MGSQLIEDTVSQNATIHLHCLCTTSMTGGGRLMANGDYWELMGITLIPNGD